MVVMVTQGHVESGTLLYVREFNTHAVALVHVLDPIQASSGAEDYGTVEALAF